MRKPEQHRTIQAHLAVEKEQKAIHHQLVDSQQSAIIQQRIQAMQPLPHRKTTHPKR